MVAASQQTPKPDVITASLGFGTDVTGFAGRYLEDDPLIQSVVAGSGAARRHRGHDLGQRRHSDVHPGRRRPGRWKHRRPTCRAEGEADSVADDAMSTTPSVVPDSGAIDVGGTTLDDTVAVPPQNGGALSTDRNVRRDPAGRCDELLLRIWHPGQRLGAERQHRGAEPRLLRLRRRR